MPEITNNRILNNCYSNSYHLYILQSFKWRISDPLFRIMILKSALPGIPGQIINSPPRPRETPEHKEPNPKLVWDVQITQIVLFLGPLIDSDWLIIITPTENPYFNLRLRQFREQQKNDIPEYKMASRMPYGVVLHCGTFRSGLGLLIGWSHLDRWLADKNALIWKSKWAWDLIIFICTIYVAALVPYQAVFKRDGYDLAASNL